MRKAQILRVLITLLAGLALACFGQQDRAASKEAGPSFFVERGDTEPRSEANRLIVFVHGFTGDSRETWTNTRSGEFWPDLVAADETFDDADVFVFGFDSTLFGSPLSPDQLADNLRLRLTGEGIPDRYGEVVFIAHSMGGIVVRAFLLRYQEELFKAPLVFFFATPTTGAGIANLGQVFTGNPQVAALSELEDNLYLQSQQQSWLVSPLSTSVRSYCAYETRDTRGVRLVTQPSATNLCNQRLDPIHEDHIQIVKPFGRGADSYIAFKVAYEETFSNQQLVRGGARLEITYQSPPPELLRGTLVADVIQVSNTTLTLPVGGILVANEVVLDDASAISGPSFSVVTGILRGGKLSSSTGSGEDAGEILVAAGRLSGTRIEARGRDGQPGAPGIDGTDGRDGARGRNGRCGAGMFGDFVGSTDGGNGTDGTDGTDGQSGQNGGSGGTVYVVTLNDPLSPPLVGGGAGGPGGEGGKLGRGGRGGQGGNGCSGIGGSQPDRPAGLPGLDGRPGRRGQDGDSGPDGSVWARQVDSFSAIARVIPETDSIPDYAETVVARLKQLARGGE